MATIDDFGDVAEPLNAPALGGPSGWAAAVRDALKEVVPIGGIIMWSGTTAPPRYAICDGTNGTPNLSGKFVLSHGDGKAIGATGGAATVTLTADQMPIHSHSYQWRRPTANDDPPAYFQPGGPNSVASANPDGENKVTANSGGSAAHENMPPYYVLAYIQRKS